VACGDVAVVDWQMWSNGVSTRGSMWLVVWCHVAQSWAATWHRYIGCLIKIYWSPWGSNPGPPHHIKPSQSPPDQRTTIYSLLYIRIDIYLSSLYVAFGGGSGRGLAPARGRVVITCDHISHGERVELYGARSHGLYI
jgi:hypothetical protein